MTENLIQLSGVYKSFDSNDVLQGLDLNIRRGETMVIIGGSGTGKSVILKHIIGLMKPDSGKIIIDGKDLATLKERSLDELRKMFGMLFQGAALFDSLSVWENVGFSYGQQTTMSSSEIKEKAIEKLRMVGLRGIEDRMPADLSGGMKKRVGLARAIAMEPKIMLYDEPTTGLDPIMADAINELILEMKRRLNVTGVAITHDMTSAYKIADRIAMLYQGKILEIGTPDEIRNSENPVVHQFVTGSSEGPIQSV